VLITSAIGSNPCVYYPKWGYVCPWETKHFAINVAVDKGKQLPKCHHPS
jgi:hypothetical protein